MDKPKDPGTLETATTKRRGYENEKMTFCGGAGAVDRVTGIGTEPTFGSSWPGAGPLVDMGATLHGRVVGGVP